MCNQICGGFLGWLKAVVTDTGRVGCIESLHRSELATFFAYDAQLIVGHLNPTNFGIDRDTGASASFCLLDLLLALLNGFLNSSGMRLLWPFRFSTKDSRRPSPKQPIYQIPPPCS